MAEQGLPQNPQKRGLRALGEMLRELDKELRKDLCARCRKPRSGFVPYSGPLARRVSADGAEESFEPRGPLNPATVRQQGGICTCTAEPGEGRQQDLPTADEIYGILSKPDPAPEEKARALEGLPTLEELRRDSTPVVDIEEAVAEGESRTAASPPALAGELAGGSTEGRRP